MNFVKLSREESPETLDINLPASKSESNRVLLLNALSPISSEVENLSDANDTVVMRNLISSGEDMLNAEDAGTAMRFMTAYLALKTEKTVTLTGSTRMRERPIQILVDALNSLGANISYVENTGYPPLEIAPFAHQKLAEISIRGDISSQYISAILMIAPTLPLGLKIHLTEKISSRPYIEMTLSLMEQFGVYCSFEGQTIQVPAKQYLSKAISIENDWSSASYWYSFLALSDSLKSIRLWGLREKSRQGDAILSFMMKFFGIQTTFEDWGIHIQKTGVPQQQLYWDFADCPDLAQTVAVICAYNGLEARFTGLDSLKIKETDRIAAMNSELEKLGSGLVEESSGIWKIHGKIDTTEKNVVISTYQDHRMAMSFAPLASQMDLTIANPEVVKKSYPNYWEELKKAGINAT